MIDICSQYIQNYPDELVDHNVLCLALDILSNIFEEQETLDKMPLDKLLKSLNY